jgi:hypothetical protein
VTSTSSLLWRGHSMAAVSPPMKTLKDIDFYQQGFLKLMKWWDRCINVSGDCVEK